MTDYLPVCGYPALASLLLSIAGGINGARVPVVIHPKTREFFMRLLGGVARCEKWRKECAKRMETAILSAKDLYQRFSVDSLAVIFQRGLEMRVSPSGQVAKAKQCAYRSLCMISDNPARYMYIVSVEQCEIQTLDMH